jgi:hypothetical protein
LETLKEQGDKIFQDINNWFKVNQLALNYNNTQYLQFNTKNGEDYDLKLNFKGNYVESVCSCFVIICKFYIFCSAAKITGWRMVFWQGDVVLHSFTDPGRLPKDSVAAWSVVNLRIHGVSKLSK